MGTRHRVRSSVVVKADSAIWLGAGFVNGAYAAALSTDTCDDVIDGTRNAHPLSITHAHNVTYRLYGNSHGVSNNGWNYNGWPRLWGPPTVTPTKAFPSDNTSLSYALSRMNPNRPDIDLPIFLFELKDIPKLVFSWGEALAKSFSSRLPGVYAASDLWHMTKGVGKKNLEWQFAIKPFIDDLVKLLDFQGAVDRRIARLRKMQERGSVGGRIDVWQDNVTRTDSNVFVSPLYQEVNRADITYGTSRRVWVTAKMTPTIPLPDNDADMQRLARRLVFGRDISASTIWEAMPWSWLIDWFGNVGDLLMIHRNSLPIQWSSSSIMKHTVSRIESWKHVSGPGKYTIQTPGIPAQESKTRAIWGSVLPIPEFNLPFLNGRQLSILASLVVTGSVPLS